MAAAEPARPIRLAWSFDCSEEGADALLIHDGVVVALFDFHVTALDELTGRVLWSTPPDAGERSFESSGIGDLAYAEGVVVASVDGELAWDLRTGAIVDVPADVTEVYSPPDDLPDGYAVDGDALVYAGARLLDLTPGQQPLVERLGAYSVVNDIERGVSVVGDDGHVALTVPLRTPMCDNINVAANDRTAVAVATDGWMHAFTLT